VRPDWDAYGRAKAHSATASPNSKHPNPPFSLETPSRRGALAPNFRTSVGGLCRIGVVEFGTLGHRHDCCPSGVHPGWHLGFLVSSFAHGVRAGVVARFSDGCRPWLVGGGPVSITGFTSPWWLLLLFGVSALLAGYLIVLRLRRRYVMRFANLGLLERVVPKRPGWARHVPTGLFLVALAGLTVALAGPTAQHKVPRSRATVMLAINYAGAQWVERAAEKNPDRSDVYRRFLDRISVPSRCLWLGR